MYVIQLMIMGKCRRDTCDIICVDVDVDVYDFCYATQYVVSYAIELKKKVFANFLVS